MQVQAKRFNHLELIDFAAKLFQTNGLSEDRAQTVAETLVAGDLLGKTTHGLGLMEFYLKDLKSGGMTAEGEPQVIRDHESTLLWDGQYLPGPYLIDQALDKAMDRISRIPVITISIRRSHHIGCLQAYLERATDRNLFLLLSCSDPGNATVAPFGGLTGVYSPNPIAVGIPTAGQPILIDISMSETANGVVLQKRRMGEKLPQPWLQDAQGNPTNDPEAFFQEPPATIYPIGGPGTGYKGFALGLLVEAWTNALCGFGRSGTIEKWSASVFLQLIDPDAFGGRAAFQKEMGYFVEQSHLVAPKQKGQKVRLPGERALELRHAYLEEGLVLHPAVLASLENVCQQYGASLPEPL